MISSPYDQKKPVTTLAQRHAAPHLKRSLKVSLVREELLELTKDPLTAMLLNQLLYWSQRVTDVDLFYEEEKSPQKSSSPKYGWFYKTAYELCEEAMLCVTPVTFRRYLNSLRERGWVQTRINPQNKWDRTTQYRVSLSTLDKDLSLLGHAIPGFSPHDDFSTALKESVDDEFKNQQSCADAKNDSSNKQNLILDALKNDPSKDKKLSSRMEKNLSCNTEITPKTTNREHTQSACEGFDKAFFEEILETWKICTGQGGFASIGLTPRELKPLHLTKKRKQKLQSVLSAYFQNDLNQWGQFCERVGTSPFLMGHGPQKWKITLDWVLCEENLLKVLEGNFDDPATFEHKQAAESKEKRDKEISTILASIEDPVWKTWCSQLDVSTGARDSVSLWELKEIAQAKFLEVENNRLVWIGSSDEHVLSRIEDLKLKLLPLVQRIFPYTRTLRTRLDETCPPYQEIKPDSQIIPSKTTQLKRCINHVQ